MFADGLIFPVLLLALLGWLVPRLLSRVWAEGLRPLLWLAATSALIMLMIAAMVMVGLYMVGGVPLSVLFELGVGPFVVHFGRLALISALFWGPLMILSVVGLPKYWVEERW